MVNQQEFTVHTHKGLLLDAYNLCDVNVSLYSSLENRGAEDEG